MKRKSLICLMLISLLPVFLVVQTMGQPSMTQPTPPTSTLPQFSQATKPTRAILFGIDGLRWDAPNLPLQFDTS